MSENQLQSYSKVRHKRAAVVPWGLYGNNTAKLSRPVTTLPKEKINYYYHFLKIDYQLKM